MQANDVKVARLTSNLLTLAEDVAAYSAAESARSDAAIADARKTAAMSIQQDSKSKKRGRAAVVSWDLCHNPAGRAYVLYQLLKQDWDVDLIGPMWSRFGTQVWEPLRASGLPIKSFHCSSVSDFVPKAEAMAATQHYDLVYVCKPRLPSFYLGALIKQASDCPLILDVDDFELSFFENEHYASFEELQQTIHAALHEPFEELSTRYAQSLITSADALTVSNVALRSRFGGHMLRHARDESRFINSTERRASARQRLGISHSDFALMFVGTPRSHKGVLDVARALNELNDPDIVFHIVGSATDDQLKDELELFTQALIVMHPNCAFDELPDLLAGADLVPLIQDVDHAISQYQIPAKVSDALSLGIPVVATRTPPLADLIASGAIHEANRNNLAKVIGDLKRLRLNDSNNDKSFDRNQERVNFLGEMSLAVNRTRLALAIDEAQVKNKQQCLDTQSSLTFFSKSALAEVSGQLPPALAQMIGMMRNHYRGLRGQELHMTRQRRGEKSVKKSPTALSERFNRLPSIVRSLSRSYDIAFFWKQNDSNLYGRRSDMIAKEFSLSGRVGKMLHLDAPLSASSISHYFERAMLAPDDQQDMILDSLIDRQMGIYDTRVVRSRTHVYSSQTRRTRLLGKTLLPKGAYVRFVNEQLEEHGMRARNAVAWFCPVVWDAPELIESIGFRAVIADLIDDQRAWGGTAEQKKNLEENYLQTLSSADIVFANCESLAETMQDHVTSKIHVVPNGAERFDQYPQAPVPDVLKNIKGPIVGYVGNLRDRIDWTLLHEVVAAMPDVTFVFFGPAGDNLNALSLAQHSNVHVLGIIPYDALAFHLKAFDVGIVPHLNNELTERMNPLKVYNYFAAGLPIVSSEVANLESLGSVLKTATNASDFISAIRESLASPVDTSSAQWQASMNVIAWENRVDRILEVMDQSLHRKLRKSA